ncbi:aminoacyl tRNA synthase complex-interacting multifunctional protein 1 [Zootermopsis nevadensis]|nr:aminoacyl tRNA synthase complex-interacting multifunctional protein 1 [Zootermopsis nevadensis]
MISISQPDIKPIKMSPPAEEIPKPVASSESNQQHCDTANKKKKPVEGKKAKSGGTSEGATLEEPPVDVGRLDFRVGRIMSAKKHPDADSLYVEEVDVGEEKARTVVSGLVKFVPVGDLQNRLVVLLCNLKPVKMRGITSEAMVMCASTPEKVEILLPPAGSIPGDEIHVEGYPRVPDPVLNPKKKIFETVAPDLKTNLERVATYKGVAFTVPDKGVVTTPSLVGVSIK